jgi:hypothetical protein
VGFDSSIMSTGVLYRQDLPDLYMATLKYEAI